MKTVREVPVLAHQDYAVRLVLATHPKTKTAAPIASQYLRSAAARAAARRSSSPARSAP